MSPARALSVVLVASLTSCVGLESEETTEAPPVVPVAVVEAPSCLAMDAIGERLVPLDPGGAGAALVRLDGTRLALVADEDAGLLRAFDVDGRSAAFGVDVGGKPTSVLALRDGRVLVGVSALRGSDAGKVVVLAPPTGEHLGPDAPALTTLCTVDVPAEPVSLAAGGGRVLVASRWGHALVELDGRTLAPGRTTDLARDPGAVAISADGKKAFVAHVVGSRVSVVDLDREAPGVRAIGLEETTVRRVAFLPMVEGPRLGRQAPQVQTRRLRADQGYAIVRASDGRLLAPMTRVDAGNGFRTGGYGDAETVFGDVVAIEPGAEKRGASRPSQLGVRDCLLPRAAAVDGERLLVACRGLDAVLAYDAAAQAPHAKEVGRWSVAAGPSAIAVDTSTHEAVVWSAFARKLTVIDLDARQRPTPPPAYLAAVREPGSESEIAAPEPGVRDATVEAGRRLFHAASARRLAFDGRACASCHPDGRDDGLTWTTPDGLRQTPALVGRLEGTAPYGWDGDRATLDAHLSRTIQRLAGVGIDAGERAALLAYVTSLRAPVDAAPKSDVIARGDALFHDATTGCSSCHLGDDRTTDAQPHDVKSRAQGDGDRRAFDTPSLRFVGRTAPYFHDGRYATLDEVLRGCDGTMGATKQLGDGDRAALVAYLERL